MAGDATPTFTADRLAAGSHIKKAVSCPLAANINIGYTHTPTGAFVFTFLSMCRHQAPSCFSL